jgi:AraC-like DNA-binding protein/mannose-6-phosphate isomerase-like protein (cupin superfamily)
MHPINKGEQPPHWPANMETTNKGGKLSGFFEKVDHNRSYPVKIFVIRLDSFKLHWHYDYEILLVLEGSLQVFSGPDPFFLNTGDIILINSKIIHGFRSTGKENLCLFIQFPPSVFERALGPQRLYHFYLNSTNKIKIPQIPYCHFIELTARIGFFSRQSSPIAELRTNALIQTLIADLVEYVEYDIRNRNTGIEIDSIGYRISEISSFIDSHLRNEDLSADVFRNFGISEKTLYRYLKNTTGQTLKDLINTARVDRAKQLLRETDKYAAVIADECGFFSEVTFYRVFKQETGRTPKEYRKSGNMPPPNNNKIQGYLSYDENTACHLLKIYAGQQK